MAKTATGSRAQQAGKPRLLLASVDSFYGDEKGLPPSYASLLFTIGFVIIFLVLVEETLRLILISWQDLHPLLQDEINRDILARHIGVDAFCCFVASFLGWKARHVLYREFHSKAPDNRLYQYDPQAARIMLYFVAFQLKNFADSWKWNDGPEFLAHHILAAASAGGGLLPLPTFQFYAVFYMGLSEFSTAILCLLANFDDDHGVVGLGDAFPNAKAVLGAMFAFLFLLIRVIAWSIFTYKYYQDIRIISKSDSKYQARRHFIRFNNFSLGLVTVLQLVWLFEVLRVCKLEMTKLGIL